MTIPKKSYNTVSNFDLNFFLIIQYYPTIVMIIRGFKNHQDKPRTLNTTFNSDNE